MRPGTGLGHQQRQQGCGVEDRLGLFPEDGRERPDRGGMLIQDLHRIVPQPHREQRPVEGQAGRVGFPVNELIPSPVSPARFVAHRLETDLRHLQASGGVRG